MKSKSVRVLALVLCILLVIGQISSAALAAGSSSENQETVSTDSGSAAPAVTDGDTISDDTLYVISGADGAVEKVIGGKDGDVPVELSISYQLDGKPITPEELAGKSGRVTIRFDYKNTQSETVKIGGKQEKINVPIAMISGMVLDNEVFSDVEVSSGKLINDGSRTVVVGLAFPGLQDNLNIGSDKAKESKLDLKDYVEVTAEAKNFSLGMTLSVAAADLFDDLELDDLDDLTDLQGSLDKLTDAMEQLLDGSGQLYDGLEALLEKSGELASGVDQLASGSSALSSGAAQLDSGVSSLQDGAAQLSAGLNTLSSNSKSLNDGATQVFQTLLSTANQQIAAAGLEVPALTIGNYAGVLNGVLASIDETAVYNQALSVVTAAVEEKRDYIRSQVTEAVRAEVTNQVTAAVRSEVEGKVSAAVWETVLPQVTQEVTSAVKENVTAQVTEAVYANVTEQVIQNAAGMSKAEYDAAVAAGQVDADKQATVTAAIEAQMARAQSTINSQVEAQMGSAEVQGIIAAQVEAQKSSEAVQSAIAQQTDAQMTAGDIQALISSTVSEKMESEEAKALIEQNTETQVQLAISENMASEEVQSKLTAASQGAQSLISLKASLDSYNAFYLGLQSYTAGVDQLAAGAGSLKAGADQLRAGSSQLSAGAAQLNSGITELQNSVPALVDGVTQLRDGSKELKEGLEQFNEEGVQKLVDALDGNAAGLAERLQATLDAAKHYSGSHRKTIYRTGAVGE